MTATDREQITAAVAIAFRNGERGCVCAFRGPSWVSDGAVLRCGVCNGLERGQLFEAEDAGLIRGDME
jgi:hypothetical protein